MRYDWYGLVYWIFLFATDPTGSSISNVLQVFKSEKFTIPVFGIKLKNLAVCKSFWHVVRYRLLFMSFRMHHLPTHDLPGDQGALCLSGDD